MRVALLAPVAASVPPLGYGGTERVVDLLAAGLARRGVAVTLFATGDSTTPVPLRSLWPQALDDASPDRYREHEIRHVLWSYAQARDFDLVHDHTKALGTVAAGVAGVPVLTTVHNDLTPERRAVYGRFRRHPFVALSQAQRARMPDLRWLGVVHNAVDVAAFPLASAKAPYLLFLGRICAEKGTHTAVRVAQELGWPLVIAGNVRDPVYFAQSVQPYLGRMIRYVGEVAGVRRERLLSGARCLLFPAAWPEPFGLVPLEAGAAGTPVVASPVGALPELIEAGVNGYLAGSVREMARAVEMAVRLPPEGCRAHVAERFSVERMVEGYWGVYQRLLEDERHAA